MCTASLASTPSTARVTPRPHPARAQRPGQPELVPDAEPVGRRDLLDDLEGRVRVPERLPELARRREGAEAPEVLVEADDEADAHHLARRQHVDARALLVEERRLRRGPP